MDNADYYDYKLK